MWLVTRLTFLIAVTAAPSVVLADDVALFDGAGKASAYVAVDDELTVYLWSGEPVAYLDQDSAGGFHVYGFNGKHRQLVGLSTTLSATTMAMPRARLKRGCSQQRLSHSRLSRNSNRSKVLKSSRHFGPLLQIRGAAPLVNFYFLAANNRLSNLKPPCPRDNPQRHRFFRSKNCPLCSSEIGTLLLPDRMYTLKCPSFLKKLSRER